MKRYYIIFSGIVQGVGFRWSLQQLAKQLNMTGFCRNLSNGNVEVEIQGNNFNEFLKEVFTISRFAHIDDYVIKEIKIKDDESSFEVKF